MATLYQDELIGGPKLSGLQSAPQCPAGYLFARNATKEGQLLAFPKLGFEYPCLKFSMKNTGKLKSFRIIVPPDRDYVRDLVVNERKVAFTLRLILLAESVTSEEN